MPIEHIKKAALSHLAGSLILHGERGERGGGRVGELGWGGGGAVGGGLLKWVGMYRNYDGAWQKATEVQ